MALTLTKSTVYGFDATYWKVTQITFNLVTQRSQVVVALYKDRAARLADAQPILVKEFEFSQGNYPFTIAAMSSANPVAIAYTKIKAQAEFSGAQDAIES